MMSEPGHTIPAMATPEHRPAKDGTDAWRVRFRLPGDPKQLSETFYSEGAAIEFCEWIRLFKPEGAVRLLQARTAEISPTAQLPTLDQWAARYVASLTGASPSTKDGYTSTYKHAWKPMLGPLPLDSITRELIAVAIAELQTRGGRKGTGYSDKSIANQHGLLSAMLAEAVHEGLITRNPCDRIRLPRKTDHEDADPYFLTHDEYGAIRAGMLEHHRAAANFLVGTGVRWGECEALEARDINLAKQQARVTKAAKSVGVSPNRSRIIGPTKTPKSKRTVFLPDQVCEDLEPLLAVRQPHQRLFLAPRGGPLVHKTFWIHVWRPACEKAKLTDPYPRIHDLRHTYASWMIDQGVSMKVLQECLGHESIKTTMDRYAHLLPGAQEEAGAAASRAMSQVKTLRVVA